MPRAWRATKSPRWRVSVAAMMPCHVPGGSRATSLPRISSVTLPGIEMRSTSAAVSTGWVPTSPNIAERLQVLHQRRVKERSEEHTSELQSHSDLVCRLLLEKKKRDTAQNTPLEPVTCQAL